MLFYRKIVLILFLIILGCQRENFNESVDDGLPPATPNDLIVYAAFDGQIGLSWRPNNEADIFGYSIYRSKNDTLHFLFLVTTTKTYYIDQYLDYDSVYYYKITAVDKFGRESRFSNIVQAKPKNLYPPVRPQIVRVYARNFDNEKYILINWSPTIDNDVDYYEIYRDTGDVVKILPENLIDTSRNNYYIDKKNLILLKKYSYSIVSVDKGKLKSNPTESVGDMILNKPILVYPENNLTISSINEFKFIAVSKPSSYKLIIQSSPLYGIVNEYNFKLNKTDTLVTISLKNVYLEPYKTYYWRIFTYTREDEPNSCSDLFSFTYSPK
ncbi:MAG: hypothetical protein N2249_02165 [Melioribacter sp.]|nr:hypothetical protein [Melioribacter sp.]